MHNNSETVCFPGLCLDTVFNFAILREKNNVNVFWFFVISEHWFNMYLLMDFSMTYNNVVFCFNLCRQNILLNKKNKKKIKKIKNK